MEAWPASIAYFVEPPLVKVTFEKLEILLKQNNLDITVK